jgi:hypothetical protein
MKTAGRYATLDTRLALANAEDTPTEMLKKLGSDPSKNVRMAVAANPNTSEKVLLKLGKEFPDVIVENPIFSIFLLEKPESNIVRLSLARSSKTSVETLTALAQIPDLELLCTIAENPHTPSSLIAELIQRSWTDVHDCNPYRYELLKIGYAAAKNPNTPHPTLAKLAELDDRQMHDAIVQNMNAPDFILEKSILARLDSADDQFLRCLRGHPNITAHILIYVDFIEEKSGTSPDLLESLAKHPSSCIRQLVADHPHTPPHIFEVLSLNAEAAVVSCLVENPQTPSAVLETIAQKLVAKKTSSSGTKPKGDVPDIICYCELSQKLVNHANISWAALKTLCEYDLARYSIARSASASPRILMQVIANANIAEDFLLWRFLAHNPNTPSKGLAILFHAARSRQELSISKHLLLLLKHPNMPSNLLNQVATDAEHPDIIQAVAQNPGTPARTLLKIAKFSPNTLTLHYVAANPKTPKTTLQKFFLSPSPLIRAGVAINPTAPLHILEALSEDEKINVRAQAAQNPRVSLSIIESLATDSEPMVRQALVKNPQTPTVLLRKLFDSVNSEAYGDFAKHLNTPIDVLEQLATTSLPAVRLAVAQRSDLTETVLERLAQTTFDLIEEYNVDDYNILEEIASHPKTPLSLLERMAIKQLSLPDSDHSFIYNLAWRKPFRVIARRRIKAMD